MLKIVRSGLLAALGVLVCAAGVAQAPYGYVTLSGANLQSPTGALVTNATISFAPVNNSGTPISYRAASGYGAVLSLSVGSGSLSGCSVTSGGAYYPTHPAVTLSGGGGTGGTVGLTVVSGVITACTASGGSGYTTAPTATIIGYGQSTFVPVTAQVTNGAFTIQLPDTTLTAPANVCFSVMVTDNTSGNSLLGAGYSCVQPAGSGTAVTGSQAWCSASSGAVGGTCSFDAYTPNLAALVVTQTGPAGATGSAGPAGAAGAPGLPCTWEGSWTASTAYTAGQCYAHGSYSYLVTTAYTSGATFGPTDTANSAVYGQVGAGTVNSGAQFFITHYPNSGTASVVGPAPYIMDDGLGDFTATGTIAAGTSVTAPVVTQTTLQAFTSMINYGDSITACVGPTLTQFCWHYQLASFFGLAAHTVQGYGGDQACDTAGRFMLPNDPTTYVGASTFRTIYLGTNDIRYAGAGTGVEATFRNCHSALISYAGIPLTSKVMGSAAAMTGSCVTDTTYTSNQGAVCTSTSSTLTFSSASAITTMGGPIYIWYRTIDGNAGQWTYSIDSGSPVTVTTALATPICTYNMGCHGGSNNNPVQSMAYIRVPVGAGTHTVAFTQTSSGTMGIIAIGTPSNLPFPSLPPVEVLSPAFVGSSYTAAQAAYAADVAADVALAQGDGLSVIPVITSNYYQAIYAATGFSDAISGGIHPNYLGSAEIFAAAISPLKFANLPQPQNTIWGNKQICSACTYTSWTVQPGDQVLEAQNGEPITLPTITGAISGMVVEIANIDSSATTPLTIYGSSFAKVQSLPPNSTVVYYAGTPSASWVPLAYWSTAQTAGATQVSSGPVAVTSTYRFWYMAGGGTATLPSTWGPNMDVTLFNYDATNTETVACASTCSYLSTTGQSIPPLSGQTYHWLSSGGQWVCSSCTAVSFPSAIPNGTTATTQTSGDNTTKVATDAFVSTAVAGVTAGSRVAYGACDGVATSSATLTVFGLGGSGFPCTGTVNGNTIFGPMMAGSGSLSNLRVRCGVAGVNSSSGVFSLWDVPAGTAVGGSTSGTNTGLTVTYGTTTINTLVSDTTHTYSYSVGDMLRVQFTTQASETLGDCSVTFNY